MAGTVMPAPKFVGLDNNANPVSGGKLYTYVAGTTTPQPTYSDVNLTVANANPVILDSAGRATVFLSGSSYKFVLTDADDVTIWTQDNVQAVAPFSTNLDILGVAGEAILAGQACYLSDGSGALTAGRWYLADSDNAYSSSAPQIAIAPDAVGSGESGTFRLQGAVTKSNAQADFVVGSVYYIAATPGQLSATPGTNVRVMGQADSTTTLVISPNPPNVADTPTFIDGITVTSTDAGAAAAPYLDLYRESASPAASDQIGEIRFTGEDSAGNKQLYARVYGQIADPTSTSEDGQVRISTMKAGTETIALVIDETGQVLPDAANQALGSATKQWADLFLESGGVVNFDNGDVTVTHSANTLAFAGATTAYTFADGPVRPAANDGVALGVSGTAWADLFLASGGVVNWNAGDTTLTHASGKLTLAGSGAGTLEVKGDILPTVSNTPALGSTSLMWADLFLGSGAVVNFDNGDVTITHSSNALAVAGGAVSITQSDTSVIPLALINSNNAAGTATSTALQLSFTNTVRQENAFLRLTEDGLNSDAGIVTLVVPKSSGSTTSTWTFTGSNGLTGFPGNLAIGATAKLYLDGVAGTGNTYIFESSADLIECVAGGVIGLYINNGGAAIPATKKLFLDSGSDTYITESTSNQISLYTGGNMRFRIDETSGYVQINGLPLFMTAAQKLYLDGGGDTYITESSANVMAAVVAGTTVLSMTSSGLLIVAPTTGSAANVYLSGDGAYLSRSTSSSRYKHDVYTLDTAEALAAVMAMRPAIYRGKTDADQRRHVGFIAEEMAQIAPLLCTYDEGGESGTPNYVTYDRVTAYLVAVVQQQQAEIDALKARIH